MSRREGEDAQSVWALATHVGDLDKVSGFNLSQPQLLQTPGE